MIKTVTKLDLDFRYALSYCFILLFIVVFPCCQHANKENKSSSVVSEFGKYEGYSVSIYKKWFRISQYITMRDGVKLAVDIIRPVLDEKPVSEPLPAVWTHHRYHRASERLGMVFSIVDVMPDLQKLVRHGYVVCALDARGTGASYGVYSGAFSEEETLDAYEFTEWLAAQPWCDGNIGMFGQSYLGITQLMAASQTSPHLKAIFPSMVGFDLFNTIYENGIFRNDWIKNWGKYTRRLDVDVLPPVVDEDTSGKMREEAIAQHRENWDISKEVKKVQHRNDDLYKTFYGKRNPSENLQAINRSNISVYLWNGWYDIWAKDAFLWFVNLNTPKKLAVGPWAHVSHLAEKLVERVELQAIEQLRWFDYWLKGIENGIMDETAIHYATMHGPDKWTWHDTDTWPLPESEQIKYYFSQGPSESIQSVNDGILTMDVPVSQIGEDFYEADYSTTSGESTRWDNGSTGRPMFYPDMTENDMKALTYTSPPLTEDVIVIGHPIITLYVTSSVQDCDFYLYLEEVEKDNTSRYITEGVLRASCRSLSDPPYNNLELPYHRGFREDLKDLPNDMPVALVFDLLPTSNVFNANNRIRVSLTCADADNTETRVQSPAPTIRLYRNQRYASHIILPIIY